MSKADFIAAIEHGSEMLWAFLRSRMFTQWTRKGGQNRRHQSSQHPRLLSHPLHHRHHGCQYRPMHMGTNPGNLLNYLLPGGHYVLGIHRRIFPFRGEGCVPLNFHYYKWLHCQNFHFHFYQLCLFVIRILDVTQLLINTYECKNILLYINSSNLCPQ